MFKGPSSRALRAQATRIGLYQQLNLRLIPCALPFALVFLAAGASPMVAMLAGLSAGLLAAGQRLLPAIGAYGVNSQSSIFLAGSSMLLVACGSQALAWRLALNTHQTGVFLILCTGAVALAFLLLDGVRFSLRWAWQRILG